MTKTILMIHGFGAAGDSWKPVAASFAAAGYAVETPTIQASLRTVGPPPAGLAGKTLADYVAEMSDLAQAIAKRDGAKPIVFGHSMGGLIAQKLAEAGLASGLVLFAPASPADARGAPKLSPMFTFLNIALTGRPETKAVKIWKTGFKWGVLNQIPADRHDAIFATTVHDSGRALSDLAYPDRDPNKTVHVDASKLTLPILILAGARDRTTPIEDLRLVAKKYAGATFREYPDNAHWLVDEPGSAEILAEVKTWLETEGLGAKAPVIKAAPADKAPAKTETAKPAVAADAKPATAKPASKPAATGKSKTPPVKAAPAAKASAVEAKSAAKPAPAPAKVATRAVASTAKAPASAPPAPSAKAAAKTKAAPAKAAPVAKRPVAAQPEVIPAPKPAAKAPAATKAKAKAAAKPAVQVAAPAKPAAATAKPKVAPAEPAPAAQDVVAAPAKAKAKAKAAPAAKAAAAPKSAAPAKAPSAPATKAPVKAATKAPATKSTGKSSPAPKKSV